MAGLDSSPSAADGGTALASAGAGPRPAGGLSGPIAALLAALGSAQGKANPKGAQFTLPGEPTEAAADDADAAGAMPGLFGDFSGKPFGKGQSPGFGLSASPSQSLAWSGMALPAKLVPTLGALAAPASGGSPKLTLPPTPAAPSPGTGGGQGRAAKSLPSSSEPLPVGLPLLPPSPVSLAEAVSPPVSAVPPDPSAAAAGAGVPLPGAILPPAAAVALPASEPPSPLSAPVAAPLAAGKSPARAEPPAIGGRGGEGTRASVPDARTAAASGSADVASSGVAMATPATKESAKAAEAALPNQPPSGGEKFAGFSASAGNGGASSGSDSNKNSLYSDNKEDTKQAAAVGTTSAQSAAVMSSSRSNRTSTPTGEPRAFLSPATAATTLPAATAAVAGPAASSAHRAIENIARIAEAQANRAGTSDSVSFGFKVGDQTLNVRVEMRGGEVRTQFSTDSSDLRSALASEWSTLATGAAERSYHFSAPVFTTADGRPADAGSDTGGSSREAPSQSSAASGRLVSAGAEATEVSSAPAAAAAPLTAQHLHTFA